MTDSVKLSERESRRYARQLLLEEFVASGQEKLKAASVLVVGCGGLGCPISTYLTAAGIGILGLVDSDSVEESNLPRQVLFGESEINEPKALAARQRLTDLNSTIEIAAIQDRLQTSNIKRIFADYDLIVDASDNFATRYLINDACVELDKPFVSAAVDRFSGQLAVYNHLYRGVEGPTYRCVFARPPDRDVLPEQPLPIIGTVPGILGTLAANEVLKFFLGCGELLSGKLLLLNLLTLEQKIISVQRQAASPKV